MLIYPTDSYGNLCGDPNNNYTSDRPYLMYYDITACGNVGDTVVKYVFKTKFCLKHFLSNGQCATHQSCRAECPSEFWSYWTDAFGQIELQEQAGRGPDDTIVNCANPDTNPALNLLCVDFSKFICKRQSQSIINNIIDGTTKLGDAKTQLAELMDYGDCAEYYVPSTPVQHRCMPGIPGVDEDEFAANISGMSRA